MERYLQLAADLLVIGLLFAGLAQFRAPRGARHGNLTALVAFLAAVGITLARHGVTEPLVLGAALLVGTGLGLIFAYRVTMLQIPAMVALQHGAGGVAAFLIAYVELWRGGPGLAPLLQVAGLSGLIIGAATFSGSLVASAKLSGVMRGTPMRLPAHRLVLALVALLTVAVAVLAGTASTLTGVAALAGAAVGLSVVLGLLFASPIGGADMPVLISLLNATAGLAAAFCGVTVGSRLLVACGAVVAASGSILTHVMCRAMNRSLTGLVLSGGAPPRTTLIVPPSPAQTSGDASAPSTAASSPPPTDPLALAAQACREARRVIIIPGYGMALGQAQHEVVRLAHDLEARGARVRYAIHPVAGRMPGHMNVLLAEADVDYDLLVEMDDINPEFATTDLVLVVGACDVVNPAAIDVPDTPISGMPILRAHEAKRVVVCNLDEKPGYSGVPNSLYERPGVTLLLGNAQDTLQRLRQAASSPEAAEATPAASRAPSDPLSVAAAAARDARRVIIIPGYGMALGQAQHEVVKLAHDLEAQGTRVRYAIHPVAGRMPGHMNVLLAEADVDYDLLVEMDDINPEFATTDLVLVVGACDVVNPAAIDVPDTPISGMPILRAHEAKHVVVCNLDDRPGYSGVPNSLYAKPGVTLLLGNAQDTLQRLRQAVAAPAGTVPAPAPAAAADPLATAVAACRGAKQVIIIPGYGMALGQAQHEVVRLAHDLEARGARVRYAIHPVAGRMPGHMNVLLAEADVDYDLLVEMDDINPEFATTDLALVVGACDVVNPAAIDVPDTPIAGMPILRAHEAKHVVVCNLDDRPGYSGVPNSLYGRPGVTLLLGNAADTVSRLRAGLAG
jgi:NAD(P) transhydrogenase subunit beta